MEEVQDANNIHMLHVTSSQGPSDITIPNDVDAMMHDARAKTSLGHGLDPQVVHEQVVGGDGKGGAPIDKAPMIVEAMDMTMK